MRTITSVFVSVGLLASISCGKGNVASTTPAGGQTAQTAPVTLPPATNAAAPTNGEQGAEISSNAVPQFFPAVVNPCPGETDVLGAVMKQGLNPQLSKINEALFHDKRPADQRLETIAESAAVILGCVPAVAKLGRGHFDETWPTFDHFVYNLVTNVSALQLAAQEDDLDEVKHWYQHVKHSCASCHARFWKK